jgi:hypothetical protein
VLQNFRYKTFVTKLRERENVTKVVTKLLLPDAETVGCDRFDLVAESVTKLG